MVAAQMENLGLIEIAFPVFEISAPELPSKLPLTNVTIWY